VVSFDFCALATTAQAVVPFLRERWNLLAHPTRFERVTFAFEGQRSNYATSRGIAFSTDRKNRVLRPPATNDHGDSQHVIKRGPHQHDKFAIE
jgi:hypothetical protein